MTGERAERYTKLSARITPNRRRRSRGEDFAVPSSHFHQRHRFDILVSVMLRQSFTDFIFTTNTDGVVKAASCGHPLDMLGLHMTQHCEMVKNVRCFVLCDVAMMMLASGAIGYEPDWVQYNKAKQNVVEVRCKDFKKCGLHIDPERLNYGEEEIVDSFLNGREFYRTPYGKRLPMKEKMGWLKGLLGDAYESRAKAWSQTIEDRKAGRSSRWTPDRLRARLDELAAMPESPVEMDDGRCRSSTAGDVARIDVRCIHCGRHVVYTDLDGIYHNQPPEYYKRIADEIREWGLLIEVDGRSACPDCCKEHCVFRLSVTPEVCCIDPDVDSSRIRFHSLPSIMSGMDLKVIGLRKLPREKPLTYKVQCVLPEAWVKKDVSQYIVYASTNDVDSIAILNDDSILEYAEPRMTRRGRVGMLSKIINYQCEKVEVDANRVKVVKTVRSSELYDIPPTYFIVNGQRFAVDEYTADALLAFVQGYTTFITGYFSDHYPIQKAVQKLRECLIP